MRIVTFLLSCLMSLAGCNDTPSRTTIHHDRTNGVDQLVGKSTARNDVTTFDCMLSYSGQCHWQLHADDCPPSTPGQPITCTRTLLEAFTLQQGTRHEILGLPPNVRECVTAVAVLPNTTCLG